MANALVLDAEDGISGPAKSAASSLEELGSKILETQKELGALKALQKSVGKEDPMYKELEAQASAKYAALNNFKKSFLAQGGDAGAYLDVMRKAKAGPQEIGVDELTKSLKAGLGPLGGVFEKVELLKGAIGKGGLAAACIAGTAAFVALGAAIAGFVIGKFIELTKFALESANALRDFNLSVMGMTGNAAGTQELVTGIQDIAAEFGVGNEKVKGYAEGLWKAGLRGSELQDALRAATIAGSAVGDTAANDFIKQAEAAKKAGDSIEMLAQTTEQNLGGIAQEKALSFGAQMNTLKANLTRLFEPLAKSIGPLLAALQTALSVFDSTTSSGQAMRTVLSTVFGPIIDNASTLGMVVKNVFRGIIVAALLVAIGVLKLRNAFRNAVGSDALANVNMAKAAFDATVFAVTTLVSMLAIVAVAVGVIAAPFIVLGAIVLDAISWFIALGATILGFISSTVSSLSAAFNSGGFIGLGSAIVQGIASGISSGAQWVLDAIVGIASQMKSKFMSSLLIRSPSKVFAEFGLQTSMGVAIGVDKGAPDVAASVEAMAPKAEALPPIATPIVQANTSTGPAGLAGQTISTANSNGTYNITINVEGGGSAESIADAVRMAVTELFEDALHASAAPVPA